MKGKNILNVFFLAAFVVLAGACDNEEEKEPNSGGSSANFSAKVEGKDFPKAELTNATYVPSTKALQLRGQPNDKKETIVLTLLAFGDKISKAEDWAPGTYDFDPTRMTSDKYLASAEYNKWNGNGYDQWFTQWDHVKQGSIVIESNNGTQVKGTFSFQAVRAIGNGTYNGEDIVKITEGKFDLTIK